jgi:hypothetical protein
MKQFLYHGYATELEFMAHEDPCLGNQDLYDVGCRSATIGMVVNKNAEPRLRIRLEY